FIFFFQAEDGIRDRTVTGVQTCALPICDIEVLTSLADRPADVPTPAGPKPRQMGTTESFIPATNLLALHRFHAQLQHRIVGAIRSEERRVGKECRYRWSVEHEKKKEAGT